MKAIGPEVKAILSFTGHLKPAWVTRDAPWNTLKKGLRKNRALGSVKSYHLHVTSTGDFDDVIFQILLFSSVEWK